MEAVGHVVRRYLVRSQSFIYTLFRFQTEFRPIVLAGSALNVDEFPIATLVELTPEVSLRGRLVRRLDALAHGYSDVYEHRLTNAARQTRCVLLHAHFGWAGCLSLPVSRRLGLPLVTTFYGHDISSSFGLRYDELFRHGGLFVCEGPVMARHLESVGCPAEKIRIVRIGVDLDQFEFAARSRGSPFVILQTGRFVDKKGVDLSIRAFAAARRSLPDAELWLVGDGELRPELESLAVELRVSARVKFLGMVSHDDYRALANRAHAGLQPSRTAADGDTEGGAPTVLLEMQALGIPVVATMHADIPSVVADPERLAQEEDVDALAVALVELASIPDAEYRSRAERGREHVERAHDARVVSRQIAAIYREALEGL